MSCNRTREQVQPLREPPEPPDCNTNRLSSPAPVFFQAEEHGSSETSRPTSQIDKAMELERRDQDNATIGVTVSERLRCADSSKSMRSCHRTYVVFGRLFKLHHDFDLTIEGIIAGDLNGCVILIHEKQDEAWTRAVWARLIRKLRSKGP